MNLLVLATLISPASAADMRLRLTLPDQAPAFVEVHDLQLGQQPDIIVPVRRREHYVLAWTVSRVDDQYRVAFELRRDRKNRSEVVVRPTMQALPGVWATFVTGGEGQVALKTDATGQDYASSSVDAHTLHGYVLDWEVAEDAEADAGAALHRPGLVPLRDSLEPGLTAEDLRAP